MNWKTSCLVLITLAVFPAGAGTDVRLRGTATLTGETLPRLPLKRGMDPACRNGSALNDEVLVNQGQLQNVVIWIEPEGEIGKAVDALPTPLTVVQQQCDYSPRVQIGRLGQTLQLVNNDSTLHNIHGYHDARTVFNRAQPPRAAPIQQGPLKEVGVLKLRCDVHPWMTGYVMVAPSEFAAKFSAVSDAQGKFSIQSPPAGTYTLHAWHEKFGQKILPLRWPMKEASDVSIHFNSTDR